MRVRTVEFENARMKTKQSGRLPGQYLAALRIYFEQGSAATFLPARELGERAAKRALDTLSLAKIHATALAALILPKCSSKKRDEMTARGERFFAEAILPIEKTHRVVTEVAAQLAEFRKTLERQTLALAESRRDVNREVKARKGREARLKTSGAAFDELLAGARTLEARLRDTAHTLMSANEDEKKLASLCLQDEIAQNLLGIQMRLLALKEEFTVGHTQVNSAIQKTKELVEASMQSIAKFARSLESHHEN